MQAGEDAFNLSFKPKLAPEMLRMCRQWAAAPTRNSLETTGTAAGFAQVLAPPPGLHGFHSLITPHTVIQALGTSSLPV